MQKLITEQNGKFYTMQKYGNVSEVTSDFESYQKITVENFIKKQTDLKNARIAELAKLSPYKINDTFQYYYDEEKAIITHYILMNDVLHYELKKGRSIIDKKTIDECMQRENEFLQSIAKNKARDKARAEQEQKELERIAEKYKYVNAYILDNKLNSMQSGKIKKILDKKYRYEINGKKIILTRKEYILLNVKNGCTFILDERHDKINYELHRDIIFNDKITNVFNDITKTEYLFGQWLQDNIKKS